MERNKLDVYFCSECGEHMVHYEEESVWEENKNYIKHMVKCVICETPSVSWVYPKEKVSYLKSAKNLTLDMMINFKNCFGRRRY